MALLAGLGRRVAGLGSSRAGLAALGIGAAGLGAAQQISGGAIDAAMDVAFGAPDADKYFVGRELNSRYLIGRGIGGPLGTIMQATDPGAAFTFSGGSGVPGVTASMAGAGIGTFGGAAGAAYVATKLKGGLRAKINSAIAGAIIGGGVLGGAPLASTGNMVRQNPAFFNETAYGRSTSSNTAAGLNAVGDIVLGMHNARGGY